MDKKTKNIILYSLLAIAVVGLAAAILVPKLSKGKNTSEETMASREMEMLVPANIAYGEADAILDLQKALINGRKFTAVSDTNDYAVVFGFRENGEFKGYTKAETDAIGTWNIAEEDGNRILIIQTFNTYEQYIIGYNNNNDITLQDEDGVTYILTEVSE